MRLQLSEVDQKTIWDMSIEIAKLKEQLAEKDRLLSEAAKCIRSVGDRSVFGIGVDGTTHWYLADELLNSIGSTLARGEDSK